MHMSADPNRPHGVARQRRGYKQQVPTNIWKQGKDDKKKKERKKEEEEEEETERRRRRRSVLEYHGVGFRETSALDAFGMPFEASLELVSCRFRKTSKITVSV